MASKHTQVALHFDRDENLVTVYCSAAEPVKMTELEACLLLLHADRMRKALELIAEWRLPSSGKRWEGQRAMSYEAAYGSSGVREFIRKVASDALRK